MRCDLSWSHEDSSIEVTPQYWSLLGVFLQTPQWVGILNISVWNQSLNCKTLEFSLVTPLVRLHQQCLHPNSISPAPLPISLPSGTPGNTCIPAIHMGTQLEFQEFWSGPALTSVALWWVNQQMQDLFVSLPRFCYSVRWIYLYKVYFNTLALEEHVQTMIKPQQTLTHGWMTGQI